MVDLLKDVFKATELRRFMKPDGKIMHIELQLDDSILMLADSTEDYPANTTMLHFYVADVFKTFQLAIDNGCKLIKEPAKKDDDPDIRGSFLDFAGNYWAVSTQANS